MAWHIVQCKTHREFVAQENLERQGYETFFPVVASDKRRFKFRQFESMFPSYGFLNLHAGIDDFHPVKSTIGVVNIVRFGLWLAVIPDKIITDLKAYDAGIKTDYAPGDAVRIRTGMLQGREGYVKTILSAKRDRRIIVLMDLAGQSAVFEIDRRDLEPLTA
jgi:transcriptional antiterminator RfaH